MLPQTCCPVNKKIKKIFNTISLESSLKTIPFKYRTSGRILYTHLLETASWKVWTATARCGRKIWIERGEIFTSLRKLEGRIGIKKDFIGKVVGMLEKMRLIERHPCPEGTLITLPLYDLHMEPKKEGSNSFGRKVLDITEILSRISWLPKINRKNSGVLFRHLINVVHFAHGNMRRHTLRPGETLTSRSRICIETGLSPGQTQTALAALVKFGLIETFSTWAGTRVRVVDYDQLHIQGNLHGGGQPAAGVVSLYNNRISEHEYQNLLHGRRHLPIRKNYLIERKIMKPYSTTNTHGNAIQLNGLFQKKSFNKAEVEMYVAVMPILKSSLNNPVQCLEKLKRIDKKYLHEPQRWLALLIQAKSGRNPLGLAWHLMTQAKFASADWAFDKAREMRTNLDFQKNSRSRISSGASPITKILANLTNRNYDLIKQAENIYTKRREEMYEYERKRAAERKKARELRGEERKQYESTKRNIQTRWLTLKSAVEKVDKALEGNLPARARMELEDARAHTTKELGIIEVELERVRQNEKLVRERF